MISEEKQTILQVVEHYALTGNTDEHLIKVTRLTDNKTSYVERIAKDGRSIMLGEYRAADGKVIWAGYRGRTGMVYLSRAH